MVATILVGLKSRPEYLDVEYEIFEAGERGLDLEQGRDQEPDPDQPTEEKQSSYGPE